MAKKKRSWLWGDGPAEEAKDYWRQLVDSARGGYDWMTDTDASPRINQGGLYDWSGNAALATSNVYGFARDTADDGREAIADGWEWWTNHNNLDWQDARAADAGGAGEPQPA